jgi:membrane protein insertase Oxa1/YidC/SpoIIIJ
MSLVIPLMFYNMPSGLNLYYVTSMAVGIIESKRIRDHIKEREEAEKAGKVIIDPGKKRKGRGDDDSGSYSRRSNEPDKPQGWLARKMAEMQAKVEAIQRQGEKQQKKK